MAKEIQTYVKLQVPAGQASPSPPVGPALGQHGLPLMDFCNAFNARTKDLEQGLPCPVVITVYEDKSCYCYGHQDDESSLSCFCPSRPNYSSNLSS